MSLSRRQRGFDIYKHRAASTGGIICVSASHGCAQSWSVCRRCRGVHRALNPTGTQGDTLPEGSPPRLGTRDRPGAGRSFYRRPQPPPHAGKFRAWHPSGGTRVLPAAATLPDGPPHRLGAVPGSVSRLPWDRIAHPPPPSAAPGPPLCRRRPAAPGQRAAGPGGGFLPEPPACGKMGREGGREILGVRALIFKASSPLLSPKSSGRNWRSDADAPAPAAALSPLLC